jgi:hypothetical protein
MLTNLRHLAERFSKGVILRRHLPKQFQSLPLYVSPEAGLRYWGRGLETADPMLFRMVRELVKPGSVVWDVGANVGHARQSFSVPFELKLHRKNEIRALVSGILGPGRPVRAMWVGILIPSPELSTSGDDTGCRRHRQT